MPQPANQGFTLVELMLALVVSSILIAALYGTYLLQSRAHAGQALVVEMQQNLRVAIDTLAREIGQAGCDPLGTAFPAGQSAISAARPNLFAFAADLEGNGTLGTDAAPAATSEYFAFDTYLSAGVSTLGRASSSREAIAVTNPAGGVWQAAGHQPIADGIERLEFAYLLADGRLVADASELGVEGEIRAVLVSLLARSRMAEAKASAGGPGAFRTALGTEWLVAADGFRRRLAITRIWLPNMGVTDMGVTDTGTTDRGSAAPGASTPGETAAGN